jgi:hypothetical protein
VEGAGGRRRVPWIGMDISLPLVIQYVALWSCGSGAAAGLMWQQRLAAAAASV